MVRYRTVFDAFWHEQKFARPDYGFATAEFHSQGAFDDEKQFIFIVMVMEDELALELHDFDVSVVQVADDAGMIYLPLETRVRYHDPEVALRQSPI